jgi:hypothetical protein
MIKVFFIIFFVSQNINLLMSLFNQKY